MLLQPTATLALPRPPDDWPSRPPAPPLVTQLVPAARHLAVLACHTSLYQPPNTQEGQGRNGGETMAQKAFVQSSNNMGLIWPFTWLRCTEGPCFVGWWGLSSPGSCVALGPANLAQPEPGLSLGHLCAQHTAQHCVIAHHCSQHSTRVNKT